jgi:hypothetical protein
MPRQSIRQSGSVESESINFHELAALGNGEKSGRRKQLSSVPAKKKCFRLLFNVVQLYYDIVWPINR